MHLDLGSEDKVYTGLTFSVYDRNLPIPRDGKGKAEVEVFNVGKNISTARIIRSELKRPIVVDDKIANLIWDSDKANVFVVSGDFDLNGDGIIDQNADYKLKSLIQKWGGIAAESVSVETDFIILGQAPKTPKKPTFEDIEIFPTAMEKYERSLQRLEQYKDVKAQAEALSVPVFNYERFLYFTGYKTQAEKIGAF